MRAIFEDPQRRRFLLYWWLQTLPPASLINTSMRTGDKVMEYYIHSIALQCSDVRVTATTVQFNANIVLPRALFTDPETDAMASVSGFDESARALWLRDFLGVVYVRKWTLYALVAVQRLIFVHRNYLPMLMDAEHMLQGQGGRPDRCPC
jgi:hypothetical protein